MLELIECFVRFSGLKINFEKTEALWLGSLRNCKKQPLGIKWPSRPVRALGVYFSYEKKCEEDNFNEKLKNLKAKLNIWKTRDLSIFGRIMLIKTLGISQFTHLASVITIPEHVIICIERLIFNFLWKGKGDKVKRSAVINSMRERGLDMIDFKSMIKSLQSKWVLRYLTVTENTWNSIFEYYVKPFGSEFFTPTIEKATQVLNSNDLGNPSHIILHAATNDLDTMNANQCCNKMQSLMKLASEKYPSSKIIIPSLVVRGDNKEQLRKELNGRLGTQCAPYPNIHLVNNDDISGDCLHDAKHLKGRRIRKLVSNLKDVAFNRLRRVKTTPTLSNQPPSGQRTAQRSYHRQMATRTPLHYKPQRQDPVAASAGYSYQVPPVYSIEEYPSLPANPNSMLYSNAVKSTAVHAQQQTKPVIQPVQQSAAAPPIDFNIIKHLLQIYESMRQV